jgi:hypothetical protein
MLDLEWDVTARNLNAIGRWTSPVEGRRNVYLRFAFTPRSCATKPGLEGWQIRKPFGSVWQSPE